MSLSILQVQKHPLFTTGFVVLKWMEMAKDFFPFQRMTSALFF